MIAKKKLFLGLYRAYVTSNQDPDRRGRVKLKVPKILGEIETGWAAVMVRIAGQAYGEFWIPQVGDAVLVFFEGGDPNAPIVMGGWYAKDELHPAFKEDYPKHGGWASPSGHYIEFVDEKDKWALRITDRMGQRLEFDCKKSGEEKVVFTDKAEQTVIMDATKDKEKITLTDKAGQTVLLDATAGAEKVEAKDKGGAMVRLDPVAKKVTVTDSMNTLVMNKTSGNIELACSSEVKILAAQKVSIGSGGPPIARKGDAVIVDPTTGVGSITGGSSKATCF